VGRGIAEWDIELLGDCDAVVAEISRRLGWELPPPGESAKAPVAEEQPFEFVAPNRYLFRNAKVQPDPTSSDSEDEAGGGGEGDTSRPAVPTSPRCTGPRSPLYTAEPPEEQPMAAKPGAAW